MSTRDRINRARWSRDQRAQARESFAAKAERDRAGKLAGLRAQVAAFEAMNSDDPLAAQILAAARAEIARLSA